jgi:hypothetical protein
MVVPRAIDVSGLQEILIAVFRLELFKLFAEVFGVPVFSIDYISKPNKSIRPLICNALQNEITFGVIDLVARTKSDGLGINLGCGIKNK